MATDEGTGVWISELSIGIAEEGDMVSCMTAGAAMFVGMGGRTKSDGGRVTPGMTPGRFRGGRGASGGRPVEHHMTF